jgi:hypothetical protein
VSPAVNTGQPGKLGILLCTAKNETLVKFSLPENNKSILSAKYQLYLPTEQILLEEIKDVIKNIEKG